MKKTSFQPDTILIDVTVAGLPTTQRILEKFKDADTTIINDIRAIKKPRDFGSAKKTLLITRHQGNAFKPCQGIGNNHICCNYWVIDLISNCPLDCSYCILQSYLTNNPFLTIYINIEEILTNIAVRLTENAEKKYRIGTGELSDSLALDTITEFNKILIPFFALHPNATLELKTKTDTVDHILNLNHNGRTVIAWSVNPERVIQSEEKGTAPLHNRLAAAKKCVDAGYRVAFHFDPILRYPGWEEEYKALADNITNTIPPEKIAWISLGTLRFPPDLKTIALKRFPESKIFFDEFVQTNGKMRYFRPIRTEVYKKALDWLKPLLKSSPTYLCMETEIVWQNISSVLERRTIT